MSEMISVIVRLILAVRQIYSRKGAFLGLFAVVFLGSVWSLATFDLLPNAPEPAVVLASDRVTSTHVANSAVAESPAKIEIPAINLSATIANPTTTNVEELDQQLLSGAVRYPTSAELGIDGNVVLFGHSSYLPIVGNQAYKTFNGIQKLVAGDTVTVYSSDTAYIYRVRNVTKESANDGAIPLSVTGKVLTLATCNSFGKKEDRFVVTADFVESHSLST